MENLQRFETLKELNEFIKNYESKDTEKSLEIVKANSPCDWYYADNKTYKPVCYYATKEELCFKVENSKQ